MGMSATEASWQHRRNNRVIARLDRESPTPLWAQLEALLRQRLEAREFDDRFPTEAQLTREYEVSRHTVREAIRHLNRSGVLDRQRGRGTVVNRAEFEQPLGALYSLFSSIEDQGVEQRSDVLALDVVKDPVAADHLALPETAELIHVERLRWAGDEPLAVDRAWLPATIARPLLDADFSRTALYDQLEALCGIRPNRGRERCTPTVPAAEVNELLQADPDEAAFRVERQSWLNDHPLEWRITILRGSRCSFMTEWSDSRTAASRHMALLPTS